MITKEELLKVAKLSKFEFEEKELDKIEKNFNNVIKLLDKLNTIDIEGVEPLYSPLEEEIIQREDIVKECKNREDLINASNYAEGSVLSIPKVVD